MYEGFYGLKTDPFRLSADPRFCYNHRSYARAKAYVQYALHRAEGFVLITGRPGTGKTTLVHDLLATLPDKEVVVGTLVSTQLEAEDLLLMTGHAFGVEFESPRKALVLQRLSQFFNEKHSKGLRVLLIIDEAQDLAPPALEELRLLTNLQHLGTPLLQIVLLGQEPLREIVRRPQMEQIHQRLIAAWQLQPLTPEETVGYVRHRLECAGWTGDPAMEPGVLEAVYGFSKGVPRRINLICSRLLLHGFSGELHALTAGDAEAVIRDLSREELILPDFRLEDFADLPESPEFPLPTPPERVAPVSPADEEVWKTIDVGLFKPRAGGTAERMAPVSAERGDEREPAATPPPIPPITASREPEAVEPPNRVTTSGAAGRRDGEVAATLESVIPVHFAPEPDDLRPEARRQRHSVAGWRERFGRHSRLLPWLVGLAILWLALLTALLIRGTGEIPATVAVQEPPSETEPVEPRSLLLGDDALDRGEQVAVPDPLVWADQREHDTASLAVPVFPEAEAEAEAEASPVVDDGADRESAVQDAPLPSGKVLFRVNSTTVDPEFEPLLDEIAQVLLEYEQAYAEVIGYTDRFGPLEYNMALSRQRARSVANRLTLRGVPAERLVVEGQGPRDPGPEGPLSREEERAVEITVRR